MTTIPTALAVGILDDRGGQVYVAPEAAVGGAYYYDVEQNGKLKIGIKIENGKTKNKRRDEKRCESMLGTTAAGPRPNTGWGCAADNFCDPEHRRLCIRDRKYAWDDKQESIRTVHDGGGKYRQHGT